MRLFTKLLVAHPLVGICLPPDTLPAESLKAAGYMVGSLFLRGHSAGSYAGMVWENILAEFQSIEGRTVLAASPTTIAPHEINAVLQWTSTPHPPCR